ncbi:zinc finger-containing ubiquitin peptidase 1 isoform X3 [Sphaerodactylus townsendi]|uniref:zinc finger-containing ubiquitin peptidase 1 isoform X3 n=1 Tax=Sphaerodactylus townsendi TaxID=933632 RepID=UPI002026F631|nr:zinc finger-containing ubiquitin peptidase 1 isoform X3 [Sphaerodactylus townsendi]
MFSQECSSAGFPSSSGENDQEVYECPLCHLVCTDYPVLQEHVELHLQESSFVEGRNLHDLELAQHIQNEEVAQRREAARQEREDFQKLQRQYGLDGSGGYKQQSLRNMEKEVAQGRMVPAEYHKRKAEMMESLAFGIDDGKTQTSGIIEALSIYYQNEYKDIKRVWLSVGVDHFHCSLGDKGWGCGYRNFQIILSSLQKNSIYQDCLKDLESIPCISKIQSLIENSWKEGFDPQGASHFNGRLHGTKAWIGACEIYSLLTSLRLKCQIIDFHQATGPSGTHPRLLEWVLSYYSSDKKNGPKVLRTSKPPIYLQHQGCPSEEMQKIKGKDICINLKLLRRCVGGLKHKQYQVVAIDDVLSAEEKIARQQASQLFTAQRIP